MCSTSFLFLFSSMFSLPPNAPVHQFRRLNGCGNGGQENMLPWASLSFTYYLLLITYYLLLMSSTTGDRNESFACEEKQAMNLLQLAVQLIVALPFSPHSLYQGCCKRHGRDLVGSILELLVPSIIERHAKEQTGTTHANVQMRRRGAQRSPGYQGLCQIGSRVSAGSVFRIRECHVTSACAQK